MKDSEIQALIKRVSGLDSEALRGLNGDPARFLIFGTTTDQQASAIVAEIEEAELDSSIPPAPPSSKPPNRL
jgi:hypothetical protein